MTPETPLQAASFSRHSVVVLAIAASLIGSCLLSRAPSGFGFVVARAGSAAVEPALAGGSVALESVGRAPAATAAPGIAASPAAESLKILSITPVGEDVPPGRQIVLQFDRPVVPIGRMERDAHEIPVRIEPQVVCEWRWLNTSALACQLGEAETLKPATRYSLLIGPGLVAEDGSRLAAEHRHGFLTHRPAVSRAYFRTWRGPATPQIAVVLNQAVNLESLRRHLYFAPVGGEGRVAAVVSPQREGASEDSRFIVGPAAGLPLDASVHLRVEPGLDSAEGRERSVEEKTVLEFFTFPEPAFVGVRCTSNDKTLVQIVPGSAQVEACDPMSPVSMVFRSPVMKDVLRDHLEVVPHLAGGREDYEPWDNVYTYSRLRRPRRRADELYLVSLPGNLRAASRYHLKARASLIQDEFGRGLPRDLDLAVRTDHRPPKFVLTHGLSVLERAVETHLPVVVTNLDELRLDLHWLTPQDSGRKSLTVAVPDVPDVAFAAPLEVRDWLLGSSGAVYGSLSSRPAVRSSPFFSQVTPFQVHAKLGHLSSAVWVTDLATGHPVSDARVRIYEARPGSFVPMPKALSEATTDGRGLALLQGTSQLDPALRIDRWFSLIRPRDLLFVRVEKGKEMALLPLARQFSVRAQGPGNTWIPSWYRPRYGHLRAWGTSAQGVYRLGNEVQYKIYVRHQDNRRFVPAPEKGYSLKVTDPMGKVVHEVADIELNAFGAFHGEFMVPESGAVGWYVFELGADFAKPFTNQTWHPLRVLVADFTPAPFRVDTDLNGELYREGDEVVVETQARLHSGGPYIQAQARVTATLTATPLRTENPKAQGFYFETATVMTETVHQSEAELDQDGALKTPFTVTSSGPLHGRLVVESAVRDDRGKYTSSRATARYLGRDRFVGLRQADWLLAAGRPATILSLVLGEEDEMLRGVEIKTRVEYRETRAARVKGAGNAYLTQYQHSWVELRTCANVSQGEATECVFTPEKPGRYRLTAQIADSRGRIHQSTLHRWARGKGRVLWEAPPGHLLPMEPEKAEYRVGETARILIRNPFPGAHALFSVERLGVQSSWTQVLAGTTEVVELKITPDHLPGFYFSCVVTSPRVMAPPGAEEPDESGQVDLGKPTFRMGYVRVPVLDPYKEIVVEVEPQAETYRPRQRARVDFRARPRHPVAGEAAPPTELAVAVLDEAVFDLLAQGNAYFDPYRGFYGLEPLDLENFNLLTRLVGIQKFEKKGANAGGGGSAGPELRSLFKFVSYWNPSLPTDAEGRARIEFEVPDNLTGWRVLALAVTREDRMGLGYGTFSVNRPIELRPALPNQVIEGDRFDARFTVMNRTRTRRSLTVEAQVTGVAESPGIARLEIDAEPYKRYPVSFPVRTLDDGLVEFTIAAWSDSERDALRLPLKVKKRVALEAAANYGTTTAGQVWESVAFPTAIRTDVGRVSVVVSPSVLGGVEGAFRYLRDYPYLCWEQRLTKGVMASHYAHLRPYVPDDLEWPGHEEWPGRTLRSAADFQAPNGGMVYWVAQDRYVSPYLSAYTALAFHWLGERGHGIPRPVEEKLQGYLERLLRSDVFPDFYSRGMASSVRAVALAALALRGRLALHELERYRSHVPEMNLFGKAHYLMAAVELGAEPVLVAEVRNAILAHSNQTGGKFVFSEPVDTGSKRLLHSAPRSNCAILSALVRQQGAPQNGTGLGDIPFKLTRSITQERKRRDRWENTQENVFCMNALVDYSRVYEREAPSMTVEVAVGGKSLGKARFSDLRDAPAELGRPLRPGDPGRTTRVKIRRQGQGRLYYATRLFYSPVDLKTQSINSGLEVRREYSVERDGGWVLLANPMRLYQGELVRIDLYVSLPAARNFVVVDDPVPGGLEPVNRDLATASTVDADKGRFRRADASFWFSRDEWRAFGYSHWSFYHRELRHDSARFYSDYLPAGNYHLSYVAQAIAPGEFQVLPVHAEEMYDPDVFGQGVPTKLVVEEKEDRR